MAWILTMALPQQQVHAPSKPFETSCFNFWKKTIAKKHKANQTWSIIPVGNTYESKFKTSNTHKLTSFDKQTQYL